MTMDLEKYSKNLEEWMDKELSKVEKSILATYRKLIKQILSEIGPLYKKHEVDGVLTYQQMVKRNRLKKLINSITQHINVVSKETNSTITSLLSKVYVHSYEWIGWAIEKSARKKIQYTSLTIEQIKSALNNPVSGLTLSETLEKNRRNIIYKIQQDVTQSLVRGSTYKEMANSLTESFEGDYAKAIRVTRTETHRVREQGTLDSAKYANSKGVVMMKKWRNMKDSRVRRTSKANHLKMDNVKIPVDDLFDLGNGEKGVAPGNTGYAHHDINCRCILVYEVDRVEGNTNDDLAKQTFEDFKKAMR